MGIDLASYRARIGTFIRVKFLKPLKKTFFSTSFVLYVFSHIYMIMFPFFPVLSAVLCLIISVFLLIVLLFFTTILICNIFCSVLHALAVGCISIIFWGHIMIRDCVSKVDLPCVCFASSLVILILLISSGHIETNPGPTARCNKLSFGVWNLDSLLARDGIKKSFIEGIDSHYHFDIFGVCESYLTKDVCKKDLVINGFSPEPFRADCADATSAKGGVCLYYKEHLPIKERKDHGLNVQE